MNTGRFVGAAVAVWLVRTLLNSGFYGYLMRGEYERISERYPGAFREVVPAFITLDLLVALLLVYLIVKAASCFGGGMKGRSPSPSSSPSSDRSSSAFTTTSAPPITP